MEPPEQRRIQYHLWLQTSPQVQLASARTSPAASGSDKRRASAGGMLIPSATSHRRESPTKKRRSRNALKTNGLGWPLFSLSSWVRGSGTLTTPSRTSQHQPHQKKEEGTRCSGHCGILSLAPRSRPQLVAREPWVSFWLSIPSLPLGLLWLLHG